MTHLLYDDDAMVANEPLTPRTRWMKDVRELKEKQDGNTSTSVVVNPQLMLLQREDEGNHPCADGLDEEKREDPQSQCDSIDERLQERVKFLKRKVSKSQTRAKSKSDPTLKARTPRKNRFSTPSRKRAMSDSDIEVAEATMKTSGTKVKSKSYSINHQVLSSDHKDGACSQRDVSDQHQQEVSKTHASRKKKLSVSTKESFLRAMNDQELPDTTHAASSGQSARSLSRRRGRVAVPILSPIVTKATPTDTPTAQSTKSQKKKETKMSWLRKALTPMDNPKQMAEGLVSPKTVAPTVPPFEDTSYKPTDMMTSPLQQQLWLSAFRQAQQEAHVFEELLLAEKAMSDVAQSSSELASPPVASSPVALQEALSQSRVSSSKSAGLSPLNYTPRSHRSSQERSSVSRRKLSPSKRVAALEDELASPRVASPADSEPSLQLTKYYYEQGDAALVMDYSTFEDDAESVSSMDMLFNWLTCKEPDRNMRIDHRGKLVMDNDSILSDNLTWHEESHAKNKRSHR